MTNTRDNGGPAFPKTVDGSHQQQDGMSLRDWFAGMALQGMAASQQWEQNFNSGTSGKNKWLPEVATTAYCAADAMLSEKSKRDAH